MVITPPESILSLSGDITAVANQLIDVTKDTELTQWLTNNLLPSLAWLGREHLSSCVALSGTTCTSVEHHLDALQQRISEVLEYMRNSKGKRKKKDKDVLNRKIRSMNLTVFDLTWTVFHLMLNSMTVMNDKIRELPRALPPNAPSGPSTIYSLNDNDLDISHSLIWNDDTEYTLCITIASKVDVPIDNCTATVTNVNGMGGITAVKVTYYSIVEQSDQVCKIFFNSLLPRQHRKILIVGKNVNTVAYTMVMADKYHRWTSGKQQASLVKILAAKLGIREGDLHVLCCMKFCRDNMEYVNVVLRMFHPRARALLRTLQNQHEHREFALMHVVDIVEGMPDHISQPEISVNVSSVSVVTNSTTPNDDELQSATQSAERITSTMTALTTNMTTPSASTTTGMDDSCETNEDGGEDQSPITDRASALRSICFSDVTKVERNWTSDIYIADSNPQMDALIVAEELFRQEVVGLFTLAMQKSDIAELKTLKSSAHNLVEAKYPNISHSSFVKELLYHFTLYSDHVDEIQYIGNSVAQQNNAGGRQGLYICADKPKEYQQTVNMFMNIVILRTHLKNTLPEHRKQIQAEMNCVSNDEAEERAEIEKIESLELNSITELEHEQRPEMMNLGAEQPMEGLIVSSPIAWDPMTLQPVHVHRPQLNCNNNSNTNPSGSSPSPTKSRASSTVSIRAELAERRRRSAGGRRSHSTTSINKKTTGGGGGRPRSTTPVGYTSESDVRPSPTCDHNGNIIHHVGRRHNSGGSQKRSHSTPNSNSQCLYSSSPFQPPQTTTRVHPSQQTHSHQNSNTRNFSDTPTPSPPPVTSSPLASLPGPQSRRVSMPSTIPSAPPSQPDRPSKATAPASKGHTGRHSMPNNSSSTSSNNGYSSVPPSRKKRNSTGSPASVPSGNLHSAPAPPRKSPMATPPASPPMFSSSSNNSIHGTVNGTQHKSTSSSSTVHIQNGSSSRLNTATLPSYPTPAASFASDSIKCIRNPLSPNLGRFSDGESTYIVTNSPRDHVPHLTPRDQHTHNSTTVPRTSTTEYTNSSERGESRDHMLSRPRDSVSSLSNGSSSTATMRFSTSSNTRETHTTSAYGATHPHNNNALANSTNIAAAHQQMEKNNRKAKMKAREEATRNKLKKKELQDKRKMATAPASWQLGSQNGPTRSSNQVILNIANPPQSKDKHKAQLQQRLSHHEQHRRVQRVKSDKLRNPPHPHITTTTVPATQLSSMPRSHSADSVVGTYISPRERSTTTIQQNGNTHNNHTAYTTTQHHNAHPRAHESHARFDLQSSPHNHNHHPSGDNKVFNTSSVSSTTSNGSTIGGGGAAVGDGRGGYSSPPSHASTTTTDYVHSSPIGQSPRSPKNPTYPVITPMTYSSPIGTHNVVVDHKPQPSIPTITSINGSTTQSITTTTNPTKTGNHTPHSNNETHYLHKSNSTGSIGARLHTNTSPTNKPPTTSTANGHSTTYTHTNVHTSGAYLSTPTYSSGGLSKVVSMSSSSLGMGVGGGANMASPTSAYGSANSGGSPTLRHYGNSMYSSNGTPAGSNSTSALAQPAASSITIQMYNRL